MHDPYLYALMHSQGVEKKKMDKAPKSKWDSLIEDEIRAYIDSLHLEMQGGFNQLRSPAMERARITQEMKEALAFDTLTPYIHEAFTFLQTQGQEYLEKKPFEELIQSLNAIAQESDQLNLEDLKTKNFQKIFSISDASMENIYRIALAKFDEGQYSTSLALFVFLSTLSPSNEGLWLRMGITAQKKEDYDLALSAYKIAGELNSKLLETKLFSIECHLKKEQLSEAQEVLEKLKADAESIDVDPIWRKETIPQLEAIFTEISKK